MTLDALIQTIPAAWHLMALSEHPDGKFYCCLRTRQPDEDKHYPAAISFGRDYVEALSGAIAQAKVRS